MNELFPLPAGTAFFPATGEFVDGGPGAGLRSFRACALFLVAGLDVCRLTFLLVSVTGFIALRHGYSLLGFEHFLVCGPNGPPALRLPR